MLESLNNHAVHLTNNSNENTTLGNSSNITGCNDLGIGVSTPTGWGSGCPKVYFPLDSDTGGAGGPGSSNIQFVAGGKVGNCYSSSRPGNSDAYYQLGTFQSSGYCFLDPGSCPNGLSVAFWMNIVAMTTEDYQSFLTTMAWNSPGIAIFYYEGYGLDFKVTTDNNNLKEMWTIDNSIFTSVYGFNQWVHYVFTYKFMGNAWPPGNKMTLYVNGSSRPQSDRNFDTWNQTNLQGYQGRLHLSTLAVGELFKMGFMKMDELIFWEEEISADDAYKLFSAYP